MFKFRTFNDDPDYLPVRSTRYAGAYDIKCYGQVILKPFDPVWVPTGLWITEYTDPNTEKLFSLTGGDELEIQPPLKSCYFLRIYPRSSFFKKQIYYHPGIIDQDFRDEIKVGMEYRPSPWQHNISPIVLENKTRIAQMQAHLFYPIMGALELDSERQGGFGSTGI